MLQNGEILGGKLVLSVELDSTESAAVRIEKM